MAKINSAIQFATMQHGTQKRKGKEVPYIVHPLEVMEILYRMGADENLLVAGILHDVVEDTAVKIADIREYFGDDVAELVAAHTEDKSEPWEVRKAKDCNELRTAPRRVQMLVLADKLSNIREMKQDLSVVGNDLWKRFNRSKEKQAWYYNLGVECLSTMDDDAKTQWAYREFKQTVENVF